VKIILAAALLAGVAATEASAVTVRFDIATDTGQRFTFQLPRNPVPAATFANPFDNNFGGFFVPPVEARDQDNNLRSFSVVFANGPRQARMVLNERVPNGTLVLFASLPGPDTAPVLFTGPFTDPVFKVGTFQYSAFPSDGFNARRDGGTVQITAVPEPATWLSMIGGFGLAGGALRYRRRKNAGTLVFQTPVITR
jgi:hypothetical protein